VANNEQMGSKEKLWCETRSNQKKYLLKYARPNTGEDWAEKIASELAGKRGLRLPHAQIDLATHDGRAAVLAHDFLGSEGRLVHGNELLFERDPAYPLEEVRRVPQHTLDNVLKALTDVKCPAIADLPPQVVSSAELYCGYLVLDALIGNTDRHHENWGIVIQRDETGARLQTLAPTYDHGSSLGRELLDEARRRKLETKDKLSDLATYADRARSAFYKQPDDAKPLGTFDLVALAAEIHGPAVRAWITRAQEAAASGSFRDIIEGVPTSRMSLTAKEFASRLLVHNFTKLVGLLS
jgi:hypothetical protein